MAESRTSIVLNTNGASWVIGSYQQHLPLGASLQDAGFWILNDVVWRKSNPMQTFPRQAFLPTPMRTMIWAGKDENAKYTFTTKR